MASVRVNKELPNAWILVDSGQSEEAGGAFLAETGWRVM
jgi:hypothetical protein